MKRFDTVFFDLDGTLTDSAPGILAAVRHGLEKMGWAVPDADTLRKFVGPPLMDSYAKFCGMTTEEQKTTALRGFREYFESRGMFENSVYPGIPATLAELQRRGYRLTVATSKPEVFAKTILEHFGLMRHFSGVYGSTLDERRTRKDEVIAYALAAMPDAGRVVMVGDRANDLAGALANGLPAIGVLYGYGDAEELAGAVALAKTPESLLEILP